jgi:hypothetical protein
VSVASVALRAGKHRRWPVQHHKRIISAHSESELVNCKSGLCLKPDRLVLHLTLITHASISCVSEHFDLLALHLGKPLDNGLMK